LPTQAEDPEILIPSWWKVELYDYMKQMPFRGLTDEYLKLLPPPYEQSTFSPFSPLTFVILEM
jgi:hypothetical protein